MTDFPPRPTCPTCAVTLAAQASATLDGYELSPCGHVVSTEVLRTLQAKGLERYQAEAAWDRAHRVPYPGDGDWIIDDRGPTTTEALNANLWGKEREKAVRMGLLPGQDESAP